MFVTFEGPEGAGKSTVIAEVARLVEKAGREVVVTREPGAGSFGQAVRDLLLHGEALSPMAELFLFLADRAEHCATLISPELEAGRVVLCDRFSDSTVVYQGHARGMDVAMLRELNRRATGGLVPDLTVLLDLDAEVGLARQSKRDRLDSEPISFHRSVREGFLAEAQLDPVRWVVVDASRPLEEVVASCWDVVLKRLPR